MRIETFPIEGRKILVGFWNDADNNYPHLPLPVSEQSDPFWFKVKERFINRLKLIPIKRHFHYKGYSHCRLCRKLTNTGSGEFIIDNYVLPDGYFHYLRRHSVKPPNYFIYYVLRRTKNKLAFDIYEKVLLKKLKAEAEGSKYLVFIVNDYTERDLAELTKFMRNKLSGYKLKTYRLEYITYQKKLERKKYK